MRSFVLNGGTVLALWGAAATIYVIGLIQGNAAARGFGLFVLCSTAVLLLFAIVVEFRATRHLAESVSRVLLEQARQRGELIPPK